MESRSNIRFLNIRLNDQLNEKIESFLKVERDHVCIDGIETSFELGHGEFGLGLDVFGFGRGEAAGCGSYTTSDLVHYDYFGFGNGHYLNEICNYSLDSDNWGSYSGSGGSSNEGKGLGCGTACGYGGDEGLGCGSVCGFGSFDGYGYGGTDMDEDNGCGIKSYNGHKVYQIDGIPTIIYNVVRDFASAAIINRDKTLRKCFVVKVGDFFAHGKTLKEAYKYAQEKHLRASSVEERIDMFIKEHPSLDSEHSFDDFFSWHNILTGSCLLGRQQFCKEHEIDSNKNYTVRYFLELTKDAYGGDVIKSLMNKY